MKLMNHSAKKPSTTLNKILRLGALVLFGIAWLYLQYHEQQSPSQNTPTQTGPAQTAPAEGVLEQAFENRTSDLMVTATGRVKRVLADDNKGSRHQRFLVEFPSGLSILVAHNIDLAPRVPDLEVGASITVRGEYEWNDKGGVVHWTHHDPRGRHEDGWIEYRGQRYG